MSHSARNESFADKLADVLARHRIDVWYSGANIQGADEWFHEIRKALVRCDWFLLALSPSALKSTWVERELLFALGNTRFRNRLTPLLIRDCRWRQLWWPLEGIQRIDFRKHFVSGCRELLQAWGVEYCDQ